MPNVKQIQVSLLIECSINHNHIVLSDMGIYIDILYNAYYTTVYAQVYHLYITIFSIMLTEKL